LAVPIKKRNTSGFLFLSIVLAIIFIIVVLMPIEPSDFWTYLRIGQEIVRTHQIPTTEFMTFTQGGQPAEYSYWLASITFWWIFQAGGVWATALVTGIAILTFYLFLWLCLRKLSVGPISSIVILLIVALMGSNNWSTRPQIFAFPLFGISLWILLKWQIKENQLLWLLPVITILWVNLHGSFILSFLLMISALIFGEGEKKKLLVSLALSIVATLINPNTFHIWSSTISMIGNPLIKTFSFEWFPPANIGWQLNLFFGSMLIIPLVAAFSLAKAKTLSWVWYLGFGWMALSSARYIIWFSIIEAIIIAEIAGPYLGKMIDQRSFFTNNKINIILGIFVLISSLAFLPGFREKWWSHSPPNYSETTPLEAVEWLLDHPEIPGSLWANWEASIYMTYAIPERKVWITNRIEDFPEELLLDNKKLMRASYDWQEILDRYEIKLLLLDQKYDEWLISAVRQSQKWTEIYSDRMDLIFIESTK
jgi:hypothetical protein